MKNFQVLNAAEALAKLAQVELKAPTSIKIRRLIRQVAQASEDIEAERKKILEKHAKRKPSTVDGELGEMLYLNDEKTQVDVKQPDFNDALAALYNADADFVVDRPLREKDFEDTKITAALLLALDALFDDEEPANPTPDTH